MKKELKLNLSKNRLACVRSCVQALGYRSFVDFKGNSVTTLKRRTARNIQKHCVSSAYPLCHYARELIEKQIDFSKVCIPVRFVKRGLKGFTFESAIIQRYKRR